MTEISPDDQAARDVAAARLLAAADALAGHGSNLSEALRAWAAQVAENPWPGWGVVAHALVGGGVPAIPSDDDLTALLERWVPPATMGEVRRIVRRLLVEATVPRPAEPSEAEIVAALIGEQTRG